MKTPQWYEDLSTSRKEDLDSLLSDSTIPYAEISREFGIPLSSLHYYANDRGLRTAKPRKPRSRAEAPKKSKNPRKPTLLSEVEQEIAALAAQLEANRLRMDGLRQRRAELSVRFEGDRNEVKVWGIAAAPMVASAQEWLQFLNLEGAKKLREYIAALPSLTKPTK